MEYSPQTLFIAVATLGVLVIALLGYTISLRRRFKKIFKSETGNTLDAVMETHLKRTSRLEEEMRKQMGEIERIKIDFKLAYQKINVIRYHSFEEPGAPNSFTLVALDGNNNGFLLTHLQLRDTVRLYVKPVAKGLSQLALSKEEERILDKTRTQ